MSSCTKDSAKLPVPEKNTCSCTYKNDIRPIMLNKCAVAGCHVADFPFGNFTGYSDLKTRIDNGKVQSLVLDLRLMPPSGATPLSAEEEHALKCWIENGAPQD